MGGTRGHDRVHRAPSGLLLVERVVLRVRVDVVLLDADDLADTHDPGEEGVLTEVLEVAPGLRDAGEVDARGEEHVVRPCPGLEAGDLPPPVGVVDVERRRDADARRQGRRGRVDGAVAAADARGSVRHADQRDAELGDALEVTPDTGEVTVLEAVLVVVVRVHRQLEHLLLERHGVDEEVCTLLGGQGGVHPGQVVDLLGGRGGGGEAGES